MNSRFKFAYLHVTIILHLTHCRGQDKKIYILIANILEMVKDVTNITIAIK